MPSVVCSAGVLPRLAMRVLEDSLMSSLFSSSIRFSSPSGWASRSSTDSLRVVTCSFRAFTSERMAEIASVSAGVSCSDLFSSSRSAMSVWWENSPNDYVGQQTLSFLGCQLLWHVNLVSVDSSRFLLIFVNRSELHVMQ